MHKKRMWLLSCVFLVFLLIISCKISVFEDVTPSVPTNTTMPPATIQPTLEPTLQPTVEPTLTPTEKPTESNVPGGWLTYTSTQYGFEISYPSSYDALDDADNLYGWPNSVVLLYNGGQSYDIAIQVWDSTAELTSNYPSAGEFITVIPAGNQFISIFNVTQETDNPAIIATFRLIN